MGELVAEINTLVRRHLVAARDGLSALIDKLLDADPSQPAAVPGLSLYPETVSRRVRRSRSRTIAAEAQTAPAPTATPASDWPSLKQQIRARMTESGAGYAVIAAMIECAPRTLETWLCKNSAPPGRDASSRIRRWLANGAVIMPLPDMPPNRLTEAEQVLLTGHISHDDARQLQSLFGATPDVLADAAAGVHLSDTLVARVRTALAGAAAE